MRGHNICFRREIRKLSLNHPKYPLLSRGLLYLFFKGKNLSFPCLLAAGAVCVRGSPYQDTVYENKYLAWVYGVDRKSVMRVTDRYHEACRVMPNSDPE